LCYNLPKKGGAALRKILDKMFGNKKTSIIIPILVSVLFYLLFVIFGVAEDKMNIIISTPIASVFWFFGIFFIVYIQIKNKNCPEGFLNFFEFMVTVVFGVFSVALAISFIISGFKSFSPLICAGLITYASVSWAHSKRTK